MRYVVRELVRAQGVCCTRELLTHLGREDHLTLVAPGNAAKCVESVERVTRRVEVFDVVERPLEWLQQPNVTLLKAAVTSVDDARQTLSVQAADGRLEEVPYDRLCVAAGARPRELPCGACSEHVLTLRDIDSVAALAERLRGARRVLLVGNGGIALELVDALSTLKRHELVWVVRHGGIGDAFFDRDAAQFLQVVLTARVASAAFATTQHVARSAQPDGDSAEAPAARQAAQCGAAVGPHWLQELQRLASAADEARGASVRVELNCELAALEAAVQPADWPLRATLSSGAQLDADVIVVATGVQPCVDWAPATWLRGVDGGLAVDARMRVTGAPSGVFAAGDAASAEAWAPPHWHQMRLWSQARAAGTFAAKCMACVPECELQSDSSFELFAHCTRFLGQRVVLLGRYNGQGLADSEAAACCSYSRVTPPGPGGVGGNFVRVLLLHGRLRGAVLIGDDACGLAETFEHLILDELDLAPLGPHLLDPDVDLEDYFD